MPAANDELPANDRSGTFGVSADILFLSAFTLIAFLIRYFFIPHDYVINGDGAYYTILGERFVSGDPAGGISAYWSPLYSTLTGTASLLFAERDFAGRFVSLVAGSLLIIPTFFLTREFFGRTAAYLCSIFLIFHPFLIKSSGWVMTESLHGLILTTCVLSGWHALSKWDWRFFLATGLLIGIAFLNKPEAIGYLLLMFPLTLAAKFVCQKVSFASTGLNYLILVLGFTTFFLPYFLFLHHKTGHWTLSQKIAVNLPAADFDGDFLSLTHDGRMTMKDIFWADDYSTVNARENVPENAALKPAAAPSSLNFARVTSDISILGAKALTLLKYQLRRYFPAILPIPLAIFAIAGFFFGTWDRSRTEKEIYMVSFVLSTLLGYAASSVELRYLFPIVPLLIAWSARGLANVCEWLSEKLNSVFPTYRELLPAVLCSCIMILLLGLSMPRFFGVLKSEDIKNVPFEEKAAGLWINEHSNQPHPIVISSHITPAFYANGKHLYLPSEELSTIVEYARRRHANYLVFSERRYTDAAAFLAEKNTPLQSLDLVYRDRQIAGHEIVVYQLNY